MSKTLKQPLKERQLFTERVLIATIIVLLLFALILSRYFYLQVIKHEHFQTQADQNRIKTTRIKPTRGLIYDRNGILLADNITTYRLLFTEERSHNTSEAFDRIQSIIPISKTEREDIEQQLRFNPVFKPMVIKDKLNGLQVAEFAVNQHQFPGFSIEPYQIRQYRYPIEMSHVIGYVGKISPAEFDRQDPMIYSSDDYFGKVGLEKHHEHRLHGTPGLLTTEINAQGKQLSQKITQAPANGEHLNLTIDLNLQLAAFAAFGEETGSAIAVDIGSGEILAMVSKPGYDTNEFINGISHEHFRLLTESADKPLFDRSIKGGYEPGSTIKPYIALAGLYHGLITPEYTMFSNGVFQLPNQERKYHDWKQGGHGQVNVVDSLAESVNVFFYDLAYRLGIDRIHAFLQPFRFGQKTGIDISGEKTGILPSREWKQANRNMIWFPGETVITGIGQGYFVLTPIQMAQALSILASKGEVAPVHLVQNEVTKQHIPITINNNAWGTVHQGMTDVINGENGTGKSIRSKEYLIAGKSGTSQVFGKTEEEIYKTDDELPKHLRNHALFIAFAPADKPKIAVVVVAEHGASGTRAAAPIARKIIDHYMQAQP